MKLEDDNEKGKIITTLPTILKEDLLAQQEQFINVFHNLQNFVRFSNSNHLYKIPNLYTYIIINDLDWIFLKSILSKTNNSAQNIKEL